MLASPISINRNLYDNTVETSTKTQEGVSFKGLAPELAEAKYNVLHSYATDMFAKTKDLVIKMPENDAERTSLIKFLQHRLNLEKLIRYTNQKFELLSNLSIIKQMKEENPSNPKLAELIEKVEKQGNTDSILKTLEEKIKQQKIFNKSSYDYLCNMDAREDELRERKLINDNKIDKYIFKAKKNNINKDGKYSVQELIDIVNEKNEAEPAPKISKSQSPKIVKNQKLGKSVKNRRSVLEEMLLDKIKKEYEEELKKSIDVYTTKKNQFSEANLARRSIVNRNIYEIKSFPDSFATDIADSFVEVDNKFIKVADKVSAAAKTYPIGMLWDDMAKAKNEIKILMKDINKIKTKLEKNSDSKTYLKQLKDKEAEVDKQKQEYIANLKASVILEKVNERIMRKCGSGDLYHYLTDNNKNIIKNRELYEIYRSNNSFSEETWNDILK